MAAFAGEGLLAQHMAQLAAGMNLVLTQNQIVHRYIALLEMNQRSKRRIGPDDEQPVRQLRDEGISFVDIGRLLRISPASANLLYHGKYLISNTTPKAGISDMLDNMVQREAAKVRQLLSPAESSHVNATEENGDNAIYRLGIEGDAS